MSAVVPTSTAIVPDAVIVPPVKPVPATTLVTVPVPDDEAINDEPFQDKTCPDDIPEVSTSDNELIDCPVMPVKYPLSLVNILIAPDLLVNVSVLEAVINDDRSAGAKVNTPEPLL